MSELLNVVGLGTGVALYAMLLVMVVRVPHRSDNGSDDWLPLATAILGLTWNLCALPLYTVAVASNFSAPALRRVGRFLGAGIPSSRCRALGASRQ